MSAHLNFDVRTALLTYCRSHKMKVTAQTDSLADGDCGLTLVHKYRTVSLADARAKFNLWEKSFESKTPNCPDS